MRERTAWYEKRGITKGRYQELQGVARQYDWFCAQERKLRNGEVDREDKGNSVCKKKDPTGNMAMMMAVSKYAPKIKAIEEAAVAVDALLWKYILRCVARGESWEKMMPPCGQRQFYAKRRMFFVELDKRI